MLFSGVRKEKKRKEEEVRDRCRTIPLVFSIHIDFYNFILFIGRGRNGERVGGLLLDLRQPYCPHTTAIFSYVSSFLLAEVNFLMKPQ